MSKLYTKYTELKKKDSKKVYLFKSGIFYISLAEDAELLSEALGLKLTNLNEEVIKCGFPISRLEHYISLLQANNLDFYIVDTNYDKIENYSDYLNNQKLKQIVEKIITIDFDNTTFKEAFDLLYQYSNQLKQIYPAFLTKEE